MRTPGLVLLLLICVGCDGVRYVGRQAVGQLRVLSGRQRISTLLRRPRRLPSGWRERLELVLLARRYAHEELGLRLTGAYTYLYDTGGKPVAYNLSAAPKDALKPKVWRFPIVGSVPYLGYFRREEALQAQAELEGAGLDTLVRPVSAYSSLGWFNDPLYSGLLRRDPWRIVDLVIHETTHTTIFLRHQISFNESLAVFVGQRGTRDLMARVLGPGSPALARYRAENKRRERFARLVSEVQRRLARLYQSKLPRAEKLRRRQLEFARAQRRYKRLFPDPATWGSFVRRRLNNAVLLSYGRYNQGVAFHKRVYRRLGRDLSRLIALYKQAQAHDDPIGYVARVCGLQRPTGQRM